MNGRSEQEIENITANKPWLAWLSYSAVFIYGSVVGCSSGFLVFYSTDTLVELGRVYIWPCVTIALFIYLRPDLKELFRRLRLLRRGEVEAHFGERFDNVTDVAEVVLADVRGSTQADTIAEAQGTSGEQSTGYAPPFDKRLLRQATDLAETSPTAAIGHAWKIVEAAINQLGERLGWSTGITIKRTSVIFALKQLEQQGLLSADYIGLLHDLRRLRNEAVHHGPYNDHEVTPAQAREYAQSCYDISRVLRAVATPDAWPGARA